MKKITVTIFGLLCTVSGLFAQTYSTGMVPFFPGGASTAYSGKIDVTSTTVTITLVGPSTSWMGIGFNTTSMDSGSDVVIYNGSVLSDRHFDGFGNTPLVDAQQNWNLVSNNVVGGVRTAVISRSRVAAEGGDYTFSFPPSTFNIVFARSLGSTVIGYHGSGNCDPTIVNFTLGTESFDIASFKMYPNPTRNFVNIELPQMVSEADIVIYDVLGKKIKETKIANENSNVDLSGFKSGFYLMNIKTADGEGTKTLVIN